MAAVEKRKNPFWAILSNHLIFSIIGVFIVMPLSGKAKIFFGIAMCFFYYMTFYDYCLREAIYHKRPYTEMTASYKYALKYALISISYVAVPVALLLIYDSVLTRLFYLVADSFYTFTPLFTLGENICKFDLISFVIIAAVNFAFSFLGYYHGMKDTSLAKIINKYIYGGKPPVRKKKK